MKVLKSFRAMALVIALSIMLALTSCAVDGVRDYPDSIFQPGQVVRPPSGCVDGQIRGVDCL